MNSTENYEKWLRTFLNQQGGVAGTVHVVKDGELILAGAVNIPPQVQQAIGRVPPGKGMAGLALERRETIHTCNLKDDNTGNVRPGAKAVDARAAAAIPVTDQSDSVAFVVGIAFSEERALTQDQLTELIRSASEVETGPNAPHPG